MRKNDKSDARRDKAEYLGVNEPRRTYGGFLVEGKVVGDVAGHHQPSSVRGGKGKEFREGNGDSGARGDGSSRGVSNQGTGVGGKDETGPEDEGYACEMDADIPDIVVMGGVLEQLVLDIEELGLGHDEDVDD